MYGNMIAAALTIAIHLAQKKGKNLIVIFFLLAT